jgi:hypothetical protein
MAGRDDSGMTIELLYFEDRGENPGGVKRDTAPLSAQAYECERIVRAPSRAWLDERKERRSRLPLLDEGSTAPRGRHPAAALPAWTQWSDGTTSEIASNPWPGLLARGENALGEDRRLVDARPERSECVVDGSEESPPGWHCTRPRRPPLCRAASVGLGFLAACDGWWRHRARSATGEPPSPRAGARVKRGTRVTLYVDRDRFGADRIR